MGRGLEFRPGEDEFLTVNAENKTAKQLYDLHQAAREGTLWPERSGKSLARRVERLREEGKIGKRTEDTRRKAYYERTRNIRSI